MTKIPLNLSTKNAINSFANCVVSVTLNIRFYVGPLVILGLREGDLGRPWLSHQHQNSPHRKHSEAPSGKSMPHLGHSNQLTSIGPQRQHSDEPEG